MTPPPRPTLSHTRPARPTLRLLVSISAAALTLALPGCGAARRAAHAPTHKPSPAPNPTRVVASESRIDAVVGRTLVVPVTLQGPVNPGKPVPVRLDDGRKVEASLYWVSVSPDPAAIEGAWLAPAGRWAATPASAGTRPSAAGAWVLTMDLPVDSIGQAVVIGGQRTILNWLPDPGHLQGRGEAISWSPPLGTEPLSAYLIRLAEPEALSPVRRWRYKLLTTGLAPDRGETLSRDAAPAPTLPATASFEDPVLEALARQSESRWQIALAMLWLADADLAERVKRRLVASLDFGAGVVAPAWPQDQNELDALLRDLLNPRLEPHQHAERAAAWLEGLPAAQAWVIDDAGLREAMTGRSMATCGIASLLDRATLAWATAGEAVGAPDLTPLAALQARALTVAPPTVIDPEPVLGSPRQGAKVTATPIVLHAGRWTATRGAAMESLDAAPPGLKLGPFVCDWTLAAWMSGGPSAEMEPAPDQATAGLVFQRPSDGSEGGPGWWIYLECRVPETPAPPSPRSGRHQPAAPPPPVETARIWLGPVGSPAAVLRISSDGVVVDERAVDQGLRGELTGATVTRQADRWVAQVPIPARCIEADGTLRLAVQRSDARGRRSAWPRPMLPWQVEPGRVAVNTSAWGSVASARPASATR